MNESSNSWNSDEEEYVAYLGHERHMFAWCLVKYGGVPQAEAHEASLVRYPYEASTEPYRGLVFHDEAWHWAMLHVFGEGYWLTKRASEQPSAEYRIESQSFDSAVGA